MQQRISQKRKINPNAKTKSGKSEQKYSESQYQNKDMLKLPLGIRRKR